MKRLPVSVLLVLLIAVAAQGASLQLPTILGDHMVLQQKSFAKIWGWAEPEQLVQVTTSWNDRTYSTVTDQKGNWQVSVATAKAGGPYTVTIQADITRVLEDILLGEVWICSGQSNMEWQLSKAETAETEIQRSDFPGIRLFTVEKHIAMRPLEDVRGSWELCKPTTSPGFSAIGYFFGKMLHQELGVPVGLVNTSWGGTPSEAWTSRETLGKFGDFDQQLEELYSSSEDLEKAGKEQERVETMLKEQQDFNSHTPSVLYNGMLHPIKNMAIKGAIWYQGESNQTRAIQYRTIFPGMIEDWRDTWKQGEFPFYFVQIAPYNYGPEPSSAELREAQLLTLSKVKYTGMAVTMDIGNPENIHPTNKRDVGKRLALWALARDYGQDLVFSGPLYRDQSIEDGKIRIHFNYTGSGLEAKGGPLTHFEIAGADQVYHPAEAVIDGESILVSSSDVSLPVAVRYAWSNIAEPNLFNREGLPASSFCTDSWKRITEGNK